MFEWHISFGFKKKNTSVAMNTRYHIMQGKHVKMNMILISCTICKLKTLICQHVEDIF